MLFIYKDKSSIQRSSLNPLGNRAGLLIDLKAWVASFSQQHRGTWNQGKKTAIPFGQASMICTFLFKASDHREKYDGRKDDRLIPRGRTTKLVV